MDLLLKLAVLWFSIDVLLIATAWYAAVTIKPHCPEWWERVVVGIEPDYDQYRLN